MNATIATRLFATLSIFMLSLSCLPATESRGCEICELEECWFIEANQVMTGPTAVFLGQEIRGRDDGGDRHGLNYEGFILVGNPGDTLSDSNPYETLGEAYGWAEISNGVGTITMLDRDIETLIDIEDYISKGGGNLNLIQIENNLWGVWVQTNGGWHQNGWTNAGGYNAWPDDWKMPWVNNLQEDRQAKRDQLVDPKTGATNSSKGSNSALGVTSPSPLPIYRTGGR